MIIYIPLKNMSDNTPSHTPNSVGTPCTPSLEDQSPALHPNQQTGGTQVKGHLNFALKDLTKVSSPLSGEILKKHNLDLNCAIGNVENLKFNLKLTEVDNSPSP